MCIPRTSETLTRWLVLTLEKYLVENINLKTVSHTLVVLNKVIFLDHGILLSLAHSNQGPHFEN